MNIRTNVYIPPPVLCSVCGEYHIPNGTTVRKQAGGLRWIVDCRVKPDTISLIKPSDEEGGK